MTLGWKKTFALFLGGQSISIFGSMLVQYAITWYITLTTKSGSLMTISIICGTLPTFFILPFGGVIADRFDRRKIMILADSAIAIVTLALAISFSLGHQELWLLFLAQAVRAIGGGFHSPAVSAFLPQIVPKDDLMKANAAMASIQSAIMLGAPLAAGALMAFASVQALFFVDVATAALAIAVLLAFVRVPPHERALSKIEVGYWKDLRDGFAYISGHAYVKRFFLFCAAFFFLVAPVAFLTPLQVARSFGDDVWRLTAIEVLFSVGMMAGGALIGVWGGFQNRVRTMALSSFAVGATTLALGLLPWFVPYLAAMALCGVSIPLFNTPATVLLQEKVEPEFMGRVFGAMGMISTLTMPLGMLVFGPLADSIRIEYMLIATGAGIFLLGFSLLGNRVLIAAGRKPEGALAETGAPASDPVDTLPESDPSSPS